VLSTAPITVPSFDETFEFALSVAVVDTCRVMRVRETTARGVYHGTVGSPLMRDSTSISVWYDKNMDAF
jgi:hypothetical protein